MKLKEPKHTIDFKNALEDKYFSYALSTIMSRSLPDLRDGLKPVHRRLLHAMRELNLDPKNGFKKCARIVGDVIGKFHPHADVAVYDALVRMAQHFSMRYPIIEGQGNFGSVDGDSQAAMRYTEAKLTPYAMLLLQDIESDTVNFRPTYDGSDTEPMVLPSSVPNILANGAEGIAVGMATSIPPHNILELFDALLILTNNPDSELNDILKVVNGPDFPGGGEMIDEPTNRHAIYETGRGSFRLRAKWYKEELERGKYQIVITEIPYQVNKRRLIEQLAELYQEKKIQFVENFQDQSAEDIRVVIIPKSKDLDPDVVMESLYQMSELEVKINVNLNVLNKDSQPNTMGIKEILSGFLEHRKEVLKRKIEYSLKVINKRIEILAGLIIAYLNLDEVIRIIREEDDPKEIMIAKWELSDVQAESILNTRLRALRKLEEQKIHAENEKLTQEKESLENILNSPKNFKKYLKKDLEDTKKLLVKDPNSQRKTNLIELPNVDLSSVHNVCEKYPITIVLSKGGWLKAYKEHDNTKIKYRNGDEDGFIIHAYSNDKIVIFSSFGKFYNINVSSIQMNRGDGEPVKLIFDFADNEEVVSIFVYKPSTKYLIASKSGKGFLINDKDLLSHTKAGKNILNVDKNDAFYCQEINAKYIMVLGENRRLLVFNVNEIPLMKRGKGVFLQKYKSGSLHKIILCNTEEEVYNYLPAKLQKLELWKALRGSQGRLILDKTLLD